MVLSCVLGYDTGEYYGIAEGKLQMSGRYPAIVYTEESMREGMQIKDANIPIDAKVAPPAALSETGLKRIVLGSFASPRYTPQMARIDELMQKKFHPREGVTYYPWQEPITRPSRDRVEQGLPAFELDGGWPWNEPFSPNRLQSTSDTGA